MSDKTAAAGTRAPQKTGDEYAQKIASMAQHVLDVMAKRVPKESLARIKDAFEFAREAHRMQSRKSGEPYIMHPISVANIAAEEMKLDANSVICAFLHDVVEDTEYTLEDIRERFGDDVAFLVDVVTKKKRGTYKTTKQVDNYEQLLSSLHYDIRALLVKIADRLHNMRTLSSMKPTKQMKIAGETDYFYAPLANRLGLFDVKTDLENLSFKYRCPVEYADLEQNLRYDMAMDANRLKVFCKTIEEILSVNDIWAKAEVYYRRPYSIWRRMKSQDKDYMHIDNRYYVRVTYTRSGEQLGEKAVCMKIYALLTDTYKEKPHSFVNQIDQAKENSYQSLNVMLLSEEGIWEDVQICSERMVEASKIGCMAERDESNVGEWIDRFKKVLEDISERSTEGSFLESVATSLYYDDVMVFTPKGRAITLPKGSSAIDFAFELHTEIGLHALYARINGKLCSLKTILKQGDCVEIGTSDDITATQDWFDASATYKAKRMLRGIVPASKHFKYTRCPHCHPLPGGEIIGINDDEGKTVVHRRSCPEAIHVATKYADRIVAVDFDVDPNMTYLVTVTLKAIDRYHLLMDLVETITTELKLSIDSLHTVTTDHIVDCTISYFVHGAKEFISSVDRLYKVKGVDELRY